MPNNFFDEFPGFEPDPTAPIELEYTRLARHMRWKPKSKAWKTTRDRYYSSEFIANYGNDASRLQTWQSLCEEVRIKRTTESITQCKKVCSLQVRLFLAGADLWKALSNTHVNLVDLVNCHRAGTKVHRFSSCDALQQYTANTPGKIFPKRAAKEDGFLKVLLRDIF